MTITTDGDLPDHDNAQEFYAKYEPKEILGRGVSSTVRKCIDKVTGAAYAVKIIDLTSEMDEGGDGAVDSAAVENIYLQVLQEISILKTCRDHPYIMQLHDSYECPTFIFLVTEMCPKGELFDYLTEVVTLSEKRTRSIMRQLLEAVLYCHDRNIVHRDLKPENILLHDDLTVKLSDFGFATHIAHDQELFELCGTPGYLAPDVLKVSMYDDARGYGRPVDMWACGVIMYTLLVGCPPFWHRKQMFMLRAIMEGKYSLTGPEWADVTDTPKDLISKLLVVDPGQRYTAAQALAHPFFKREERDKERRPFFPGRTFKAAVITIVALHRIKNLHLNPPPVRLDTVQRDPYSLKMIRKVIDAGAFRMYGHWVKKAENQNRAALFENVIRREGKVAPSSYFGIEFAVGGQAGTVPMAVIIHSP